MSPRPNRPAARRTPQPTSARHGSPWHWALVALAAFAVHAGTLRGGFVWDDDTLVVENPAISNLGNAPRWLAAPAFAGAGGEALAAESLLPYYRPAWTASLALDHALWGLRPFGYHLTNVLLHALAALALFSLLRALIRDGTAALLGALWFAVHPVHVEAVAWISARNDVLATLFAVLSLGAYLSLRRGGNGARAVVCVATFALALLSKELAVVVPLLALALEPALERPAGRRRVVWLAVLGAMAIGFVLVRAAIVDDRPDPNPLAARLLMAPRLIAEYLRLLVAPLGLRVYHDLAPIPGAAHPAFLTSILVLLVWGLAAVAAARRDPALFSGLAWITIALLPVAGVVVTLRPAPLAERYLYLASAGGAIAVAALLQWLGARPGGRRAAHAVAVLVLAAFAAASVSQAGVWRDEETLMRRMVRDAPRATSGHVNLGVVHESQGRLEEAAREFETAVALAPGDHQFHRNLGVVYARLNRKAEAESAFARAVRLAPGNAEIRYAAGWFHTREGRWEEARREYAAAVALRPRHAQHRVSLSVALRNLGRMEEAEAEARRAAELDPGLANARYVLAVVLDMTGRFDEAERELRAAVALGPGWGEARLGLAIVLDRRGLREEARAQLDSALVLAGDDADLRARVRAAIEASGRR